MCTNFLESGEYCEKCAGIAEAESYMKTRTSEMEEREASASRSAIHETTADEEAASKSRDKDRVYIWGGAFAGVGMLFMSLGLYAFPNLFADDAVLAQQELLMSREQCRLVFQEISYVLARGEMPDPSLRCAGTNIPNVVTRTGNVIRVAHPNPAQFGLQELSVTNQSYQVTAVVGG